ncbi:MAG: glycine cleavage system protein H [Anaerolineae bacterium]|jgi:glycine cleavage system H protein
MKDVLEYALGKFTFHVLTDRFYSSEGLWAEAEGGRVRIGLSDFVQQRNGDVAFAEVRPEGTSLALGDEVAVIETIKVDVYFTSPVTGQIVEINPALETAPEVINQDPYGEGWLAAIAADDWETDREQLLDPQAYFELMRQEAEEEGGSL